YYLGSSRPGGVAITRADVTISYTGPPTFTNDLSAVLSAQLLGADGAVIDGKAFTFVVGQLTVGTGAQSCSCNLIPLFDAVSPRAFINSGAVSVTWDGPK